MRSEIRRWLNARWWPTHIEQLERERADWKRWCEDAESKSFAAAAGDTVLYREMTEDEMKERLTSGEGIWCHPIVQVYPEKGADGDT